MACHLRMQSFFYLCTKLAAHSCLRSLFYTFMHVSVISFLHPFSTYVLSWLVSVASISSSLFFSIVNQHILPSTGSLCNKLVVHNCPRVRSRWSIHRSVCLYLFSSIIASICHSVHSLHFRSVYSSIHLPFHVFLLFLFSPTVYCFVHPFLIHLSSTMFPGLLFVIFCSIVALSRYLLHIFPYLPQITYLSVWQFLRIPAYSFMCLSICPSIQPTRGLIVLMTVYAFGFFCLSAHFIFPDIYSSVHLFFCSHISPSICSHIRLPLTCLSRRTIIHLWKCVRPPVSLVIFLLIILTFYLFTWSLCGYWFVYWCVHVSVRPPAFLFVLLKDVFKSVKNWSLLMKVKCMCGLFKCHSDEKLFPFSPPI